MNDNKWAIVALSRFDGIGGLQFRRWWRFRRLKVQQRPATPRLQVPQAKVGVFLIRLCRD
jgi:hypothetical protein